jgi:hypothetical protein
MFASSEKIITNPWTQFHQNTTWDQREAQKLHLDTRKLVGRSCWVWSWGSTYTDSYNSTLKSYTPANM